MKLKGITDKGMKRIAQELGDGGPPYSGSRDALLENTNTRVKDEVGFEFTLEELQDLIDTINSDHNGERIVYRDLERFFGFSPEEADKVLNILAWSAHEMLDYDFLEER